MHSAQKIPRLNAPASTATAILLFTVTA
jgi:hypothetical protein